MKRDRAELIRTLGESYFKLERRACSLSEWFQLKLSCPYPEAVKYATWWLKDQKKRETVAK